MEPIYLDYNATTPIDAEVAEAMRPFLELYFGNPSSMHAFGAQTKMAVEKARQQVATLLNCQASEVIFTSGGTESNNYAIKGVAMANRHKGNHIITSQIEHPAVIEVCKFLEGEGFDVTYLPVDECGLVNPEALIKAIKPTTILITIMHANNEVGSIQPIQEISAIAKKQGILMHTDAAQSLGKISGDVLELGVDLLSVAGHKLYAPKGIGALYIRSGVVLQKLIHGADHERNLRAGTENVLEIVGLGKACEIVARDLNKHASHYQAMRDVLHQGLVQSINGVKLNGPEKERLPNTLSLSFRNVEANTLLSELDGVAASAGAACHTDSVDVSSVLSAMQVPTDWAMGTIRFSTGRANTKAEMQRAVQLVAAAVKRLQPTAHDISPAQDEEAKDVKLTHFTHGMGCACKLRPQDLEQVLKDLPSPMDPNVLVGAKTSDDAAVYRINDAVALVQTLDFFTPIVDDPYQFGCIAAANALSDVYAMGGKPLFALNIVGFPSTRLPLWVLKKILQGAQDQARAAGIEVLGGHTVEDTEPKFGMVVTGTVHPNHILSNATARTGDVLVLTKPIGTGIISTAVKRGLATQSQAREVSELMAELNKTAAEKMLQYDVSACTDVTGFGLLGHLKEMTEASKLDAEIWNSAVPVLDQVPQLVAAGVVPGGTANNLAFLSDWLNWDSTLSETDRLVLCDAQTSGGLLIALPENQSQQLLLDLQSSGMKAAIVGRMKGTGNGVIHIKS